MRIEVRVCTQAVHAEPVESHDVRSGLGVLEGVLEDRLHRGARRLLDDGEEHGT